MGFNPDQLEQLLTNREDDSSWPRKNVVGRQELEVRLDKEHISFEVGHSAVTAMHRDAC